MSETSILNTLMVETLDYLGHTMMTDIADGDPTQAGLIIQGRLQADPTIKKINLMIQDGGDDWKHQIAPPDHPLLNKAGNREIGGGVFMIRRFEIQMSMAFVGTVTASQAIERSNVILSRMEYHLRRMPMPEGSDSFGEHALLLDPVKNFLRISGGPGTYLRRGSMYLEVLTEVEGFE